MLNQESEVARYCIPKSSERDALRAVFRSKGYHRVWILVGSDQANIYFFAEGRAYTDALATEMCLALSPNVPGRKAEILPMSIIDRARTEPFMDVRDDPDS